MGEISLHKLQSSFEDVYHQEVRQSKYLKSNVYFVETDLDKYVLKCFANHSLISWQDKVLTQMLEKGAKGIVPFIKNKEQKSIHFIKEENLYFAVMPFIPGKAADFKQSESIFDCIKLLGQFHAFGSGVYGQQQIIPFRSQLYERWRNRLLFFQRSMELIKQDQDLHVEGMLSFVKAYGEESIAWASWVMDYFPQAYMLYLEEEAQWERQIAHLDPAPHNFLIMENQGYFLIDYDLVAYTPPLVDVVQYINRVLPYHYWSYDLVWELIQSYELHFPLSVLEKRYLPLLLVFPNDFFREWLGLWKRKPGFHPETTYAYFQQLEREWVKRRRFVQQGMSMLQ